MDLLVCNPPYFKNVPTAVKNPNPYLAIARHEIETTLDEVVYTASKALKMNGRFAMVHRPDRFGYFRLHEKISNRAQTCPFRLSQSRERREYPIDRGHQGW